MFEYTAPGYGETLASSAMTFGHRENGASPRKSITPVFAIGAYCDGVYFVFFAKPITVTFID